MSICHQVQKILKNICCDSFKKKYAGVTVTAVLCLFSFILLKSKTHWLIPVSILTASAAIIWCGNFKKRIIWLCVLGAFTCFIRHFIIHYSASFEQIGHQALITLHITDADEIKAYLQIFKLEELLIFLCFAAGIVSECMTRTPALCDMIHSGQKRAVRIICLLMAIAGALTMLGWEIGVPAVEHIATWSSQKEFFKQRNAFKFQASAKEKTPLLTVLVIGESHRKDAFDRFISGRESQAPFLRDLYARKELWPFDNMITHYQQTWFSVFTLLSRRGNDAHNILWPEKGLFSLFREAGFETTFITYQKKFPEQLGYNFVVNEADTYINHRDFSKTKFDHGMLPALAGIMQKHKQTPGKSFIVIKMVGPHFHYSTRYPNSFRLFTPCYDRRMEKNQYRPEEKEILQNTYFNAMSFSVTFLDEVAKMIASHPVPAVMLFASDHGVINYDDGKNPFFGAAKSNFHIPCFVYGNKFYRRSLPEEMRKALQKNRDLPITNSFLFDTAASLSGITYPGKRRKMDLTSRCAEQAMNRQVWVLKKKMDYESLP